MASADGAEDLFFKMNSVMQEDHDRPDHDARGSSSSSGLVAAGRGLMTLSQGPIA